jgi:hypothetical protein
MDLQRDLMEYRGRSLVAAVRLLAGVVAMLCLTASASASLIGDSLEYDGHVKSGAATGVEEHGLAPAFPPITFTVPVTNGPLASPLQPAKALSGSETEFSDFLGSLSVQHVVITLQGPGGTNAFVNPLDSSIALPVTFDGVFHTDVVNKKIDIQGIGIEAIPALVGTSPPFPSPSGSVSLSGLGTAANPLHVSFGLATNQLQSNDNVKIHLYYTTSTPSVPEPSTVGILLIGAAGLIGGFRHRLL